MLGTFDLIVFILWKRTQHSTMLPCVFCNKFISSTKHILCLMEVLILLILRIKTWHIHFACIIPLNKLCDEKASQVDIFTNKLDNSDNATIPSFFTHFHFKSVLSSNTHSWLAEVSATSFYYPFFLTHLNCFFSVAW